MNDRTQTTDNAPIPGAQLTHLDLARVQQHITAAQERGRYAGSSDSIEYLVQQQCVIDVDGALVPTLAGILTFAGDPERWLPGTSGIDLAQFSGSDPRSTTLNFFEQIRGPIFTAIERTVELLWARSEHESACSSKTTSKAGSTISSAAPHLVVRSFIDPSSAD